MKTKTIVILMTLAVLAVLCGAIGMDVWREKTAEIGRLEKKARTESTLRKLSDVQANSAKMVGRADLIDRELASLREEMAKIEVLKERQAVLKARKPEGVAACAAHLQDLIDLHERIAETQKKMAGFEKRAAEYQAKAEVRRSAGLAE